ncbi:hypothetical protein HZ326_19457 [Fusarium oxysporum f. sp. albedinis]|nr:hypothetical protein HZ326_19457 [Fusarium oxysporum f. sp. albedinis]
MVKEISPFLLLNDSPKLSLDMLESNSVELRATEHQDIVVMSLCFRGLRLIIMPSSVSVTCLAALFLPRYLRPSTHPALTACGITSTQFTLG